MTIRIISILKAKKKICFCQVFNGSVSQPFCKLLFKKKDLLFAVVDIETTGGSAQNDRIIDFAAFITDGREILDSFSTLINPERHIPGFITGLTGIDNKMVEDAPVFSEVASQIDFFTKDKIFVAHSVNFDFSFVKNEFKMLGHRYERKKLCTVRLSRRIFPVP